MSERERWIVYPLLFFALGAAIRDKLLHQVETKQLECSELQAKSITCERIVVLDPVEQGKALAVLESAPLPSGDAGAPARRVGRLLLTDSQGQEIFGLADDQLVMRSLVCESLAVRDPLQPGRVVASLSVQPVSINTKPPRVERAGVLQLNQQITPYLPGVSTPARVLQPGEAPLAPPPVAEPASDVRPVSATKPEVAPPPADQPTPAEAQAAEK